MTLSSATIKKRLADRYTAAEIADLIDLDVDLFLDAFLGEAILHIEVFDIGDEEEEF